MSELAFLSVDAARPGGGFEPRPVSPLARALAGAEGVRDLSILGKIEVSGDLDALVLDEELVRLTRRRALVLGGAETRARLLAQGYLVVDRTGALAGLELEGARVMRRLTELDLDDLPAVGAVARVRTIVLRDGERFRLFFPQEYGHYIAEVVLDAVSGLATQPSTR